MEANEAKSGNGKAKSVEASAPKGPVTAADFIKAIEMTPAFAGVEVSSLPDLGTILRWEIALRYEGRTYATTYRLGLAHTAIRGIDSRTAAQPIDKAPTELRILWGHQYAPYSGPIWPVVPRLHDVLWHLQGVAAVPKSFARWCEATGNNPDSRAAAKAHDALKAGKKAVSTFLGESAFPAFLTADFGVTG